MLSFTTNGFPILFISGVTQVITIAILIAIVAICWKVQVSSRWKSLESHQKKRYIILTIVLVLLVGTTFLFAEPAPLLLIPVTHLGFGPVFSLIAFCYCSYQLYFNSTTRFNLSDLFLLMSWLCGFFAAVRQASIYAMAEYSKLPLEPPEDCYVATAASGGHRGFVRSRQTVSSSGKRFVINDQLAILKSFEVVVRELAPNIHRAMRLVYNFFGPKLARQIRHRKLLCNFAYVVLKPAEWFARISLWIVLGGKAVSKSKLIYLRK